MSLYINDGFCAIRSVYDQFLSDLSKKFELSDQGDLEWYLGVSFEQNLEQGYVRMHQREYIESMLSRFGMVDANPKYTLLIPGTHLNKDDCSEFPDPAIVKNYQQQVGSLLFASSACHPDISYSVNQCALFMSNPGPSHIEAAKHILRYLKHPG